MGDFCFNVKDNMEKPKDDKSFRAVLAQNTEKFLKLYAEWQNLHEVLVSSFSIPCDLQTAMDQFVLFLDKMGIRYYSRWIDSVGECRYELIRAHNRTAVWSLFMLVLNGLEAGRIELKPSGNETILKAIARNDFFQSSSPLGEIANEFEKYLRSVQPPTPSDVPKTTRWRPEKIILLLTFFGVVVAIATCIATWLVVPQVQEVIQNFVHSTIPTMTPTIVSSTPTP